MMTKLIVSIYEERYIKETYLYYSVKIPLSIMVRKINDT